MSGEVAQPPARHGPAFGEAIDGETAIGEIRRDRREAVVLFPLRQQELVDLITHHQQLGMTAHQLRHALQLLALHHPPCGVAGGVQHQKATARADRCLYSCQIETESLLGMGGNELDLGTGQCRHLRVAQPVRSGQQHLIAWIQQHLKQVVDRLLAAVGDQDLFGAGCDSIAARQLLRNGCPELGVTSRRPVAGDAITQGLSCGLNNEVGRVEIRLTGTEAADVTPGSLQRLGLGSDS